MTDSMELQNLFEAYGNLRYEKLNTRYITDVNSGSYPTPQINIDTQNLLSDWVVWSNSVLETSVSVASSQTTPGAAGYWTDINHSPVILKNHVSSIISSLLIRINSKTVESQNNISQMQFIRYLVETSYEKAVADGEFVYFAKDEPFLENAPYDPPISMVEGLSYSYSVGTKLDYTDIASPAGSAGSPYSVPYATYALAAGPTLVEIKNINPYQNLGAVKRLQFRNATYSAPTISGVVTPTLTFKLLIPLASISPLFKQFNFPATNLRWNIAFNLGKGVSAGDSEPFIYDFTSLLPGAGTAIDPTGLGRHSQISIVPGSTKLWYQACDFDYQTNKLITEQKESKLWNKSMTYLSHKYYKFEDKNALTGNSIVINSLNRIRRVWIIGLVRGYEDGAQISDQRQSKFYSGLPTVKLTNLQLYIDNQSYFESPIVDQHEAYRLLQDIMAVSRTDDRSSYMISYKDFRTQYAFYGFDVSRNEKLRLNRPVDLRITFDRKDGTDPLNSGGKDYTKTPANAPANFEVFVELETTLSLNMLTGECESNYQ